MILHIALKLLAVMDTDQYQKIRLAVVWAMAGVLVFTIISEAPSLWRMPSLIPPVEAQDRAERIAAGIADNAARIKIAEGTISSLQAQQTILVASNVGLAARMDFYAEQQRTMTTMLYSVLSGLSLLVMKEAVSLLRRWTQANINRHLDSEGETE